MIGSANPSGAVALTKMPREWPAGSLGHALAHALPRHHLPREVNLWRIRNFPNIWRGLWRLVLARALGLPHCYGALYLDLYRNGERIPYGLASLRVVTTAGVNAITDAFQNLVELENFKFHGFGTGSTAEAVGDTALVTELTTEYATDNTRPTGSQAEGAANVYRTVATLDPDAQVLAREHGIFTQAATGGGTLLDRSVYALITVEAAGDTLQATYDYTTNSGG
jgi:hypothetical protein